MVYLEYKSLETLKNMDSLREFVVTIKFGFSAAKTSWKNW